MKIKFNLLNKRPILFGGIAFAFVSLILNCLYILFFHMAHIYDIVHVLPILFIYDPIIEQIGYVSTPLIFLPVAVICDFLFGLLFGWIGKKLTKTTTSFAVALLLLYGFYWVIITYQWIMII